MGKKPNSYELYCQAQDLIARLIDSGGEVSEETERELHELLEAQKDKLDSHHFVIKRAKAESALIGEEIKRLQAIKKVHDQTVDRVKKHALLVMRGRVEEKGWDEGRKLDITGGKVWLTKRQKLSIPDEEAFLHAQRGTDFIEYRPHIDRAQVLRLMKTTHPSLTGALLIEDTAITFK